jgi:hypothetical protein
MKNKLLLVREVPKRKRKILKKSTKKLKTNTHCHRRFSYTLDYSYSYDDNKWNTHTWENTHTHADAGNSPESPGEQYYMRT